MRFDDDSLYELNRVVGVALAELEPELPPALRVAAEELFQVVRHARNYPTLPEVLAAVLAIGTFTGCCRELSWERSDDFHAALRLMRNATAELVPATS